jgi:hypothetical protein
VNSVFADLGSRRENGKAGGGAWRVSQTASALDGWGIQPLIRHRVLIKVSIKCSLSSSTSGISSAQDRWPGQAACGVRPCSSCIYPRLHPPHHLNGLARGVLVRIVMVLFLSCLSLLLTAPKRRGLCLYRVVLHPHHHHSPVSSASWGGFVKPLKMSLRRRPRHPSRPSRCLSSVST